MAHLLLHLPTQLVCLNECRKFEETAVKRIRLRGCLAGLGRLVVGKPDPKQILDP